MLEELVSHLAVKEIVRMAAGKVSDEYESAFGQACALVTGAAGILKCSGADNADGSILIRNVN